MYYAAKEVKGRAIQKASQFSVYIAAERRSGCQGSASYGERTGAQRRGGHAVGTSLKHLNTIAGHTFSKRKRGGLAHRIREETKKKKERKKRKQHPCQTGFNLSVRAMVL